MSCRNNVNFDSENNIECTPLFYAAEKGSPEVVKALLKKGDQRESVRRGVFSPTPPAPIS